MKTAEEVAREMVVVVEDPEGARIVVRGFGHCLSHAARMPTEWCNGWAGSLRRLFCDIITQSRAEHAAIAAQQPSDLAGRIRALVQEYAGQWADDGATPSDEYAEVMMWLRAAYRDARKGRDASDVIAKLRQYGRPLPLRAADELEAIVRGEAP